MEKFCTLAIPGALEGASTSEMLVRHARRLVFQLAEVMVTRAMFDEMLEKIGRLRFNPG